jgi:hypothetical protein
MFSVVPTNDTYIPENGNIKKQDGQGEGYWEIWHTLIHYWHYRADCW